MLGIELGAAGCVSKYANHCAMLPPNNLTLVEDRLLFKMPLASTVAISLLLLPLMGFFFLMLYDLKVVDITFSSSKYFLLYRCFT